MEFFFELIATGNLNSVVAFLEQNAIDINKPILYTKRKVETRAIDIAWKYFLDAQGGEYEHIFSLLIDHNSMYPKNFDPQRLSPTCRVRSIYEESLALHKSIQKMNVSMQKNIANRIKKYPNLYYFFNSENRTLASRINYEQRGLLYGPLDPSPTCRMRSDHRNEITFGIKCTRMVRIHSCDIKQNQKLSWQVFQKLKTAKDLTTLNAILTYPKPISLIVDFVTTETSVVWGAGFVFVASWKLFCNIDYIIATMSIHLFGVDRINNQQLQHLCENNAVDLVHFRSRLDQSFVKYQGTMVRFADLDITHLLDPQLIRRVLFDLENPLTINVSIPEMPRTENKYLTNLTRNLYCSVKVLRDFEPEVLHQVYYMLRHTKPVNWWIWYIDLRKLELDSHSTAGDILRAAFGQERMEFIWNIFLYMYRRSQCVLLFDGVDDISIPDIRGRVLKVISNDFSCERWIATKEENISAPPVQLFLVVHDVENLDKFKGLLSFGYESRCYYRNGRSPVGIIGTQYLDCQNTITTVLKIDKPDTPCDTFSCFQINYDVFIRYNGTFDSIADEDAFCKQIDTIGSKRFDLIENPEYVPSNPKYIPSKYRQIVDYLYK